MSGMEDNDDDKIIDFGSWLDTFADKFAESIAA
jgi:hypothetical protein